MVANDFQNLIEAKQLSGAYLLHGEEELYKDRAVNAVITALIPDGLESMNVQSLDEDTAFDELLNAVQTLPFMAPCRVVVCRNFPGLSLDKRQYASQNTKDMVGKVERLISRLDSSCCLIFLQRGAVAADQPLMKLFKKHKRDVNYKEPKAAEKREAIQSLAQEMDLKMNTREITFLLDYTDANLVTARQELSKLKSICGGEPVTHEHILAVCTPSMQYNVFTMIRSISRGEAGKALRILRELLSDNENPGGILSLLERQYRTLIYIDDIKDEYQGQPINYKELEKKLNVKDFVVKSMVQWGQRLKKAERQAIVAWCADADYLHKQGKQSDRVAIETLVMRLLHISKK